MPRILTLHLNTEEQQELEDVRDHHALAHMREKAAGLLKIAAGQNGLQVAQHGLLKARDSDTIYRWVARYQAEGIKGLMIRGGRGRKPAFSPSLLGQAAGESSSVGDVAQRS